MNIRSLSLLAAVLLLAACQTTPDDKKDVNSTGAGNNPTTTTTNTDKGATTQTAETPKGPAPGSREDFQQNVGDRVFFDYDKSEIKSEGRTILERQAAWLKKYTNVTLTVEGHCDERGTREYNLALGERRATAVKKVLVALGVPAKRISTISYGKERPAVVGSNEAAWAQNRRGVSVVN